LVLVLTHKYESVQSVFPGIGKDQGIADDGCNCQLTKGSASQDFVGSGEHQDRIDVSNIHVGIRVVFIHRLELGRQGGSAGLGEINESWWQGLSSPGITFKQIKSSKHAQHYILYINGE
jgi:hypothetical protein